MAARRRLLRRVRRAPDEPPAAARPRCARLVGRPRRGCRCGAGRSASARAADPSRGALSVPRSCARVRVPGRPRALRGAAARALRLPGVPARSGRGVEQLAQADVLGVMPTGGGKSLCYVLPALEVRAHARHLAADRAHAGTRSRRCRARASRPASSTRRSRAASRTGATSTSSRAARRCSISRPNGSRTGTSWPGCSTTACGSSWWTRRTASPSGAMTSGPTTSPWTPRAASSARRATLALTATADPVVRRDILERLGIAPHAREVVTSFDRPNLRFAVLRLDSARDRLDWLVRHARERPGQSGIVYARTRKAVEETAESLVSAGIPRSRTTPACPAACAPRRSGASRPASPADRRDERIRARHRQARRPLRRPPRPAGPPRGLLPGGRPRRARRRSGRVHAALRAPRRRLAAALHRPGPPRRRAGAPWLEPPRRAAAPRSRPRARTGRGRRRRRRRGLAGHARRAAGERAARARRAAADLARPRRATRHAPDRGAPPLRGVSPQPDDRVRRDLRVPARARASLLRRGAGPRRLCRPG